MRGVESQGGREPHLGEKEGSEREHGVERVDSTVNEGGFQGGQGGCDQNAEQRIRKEGEELRLDSYMQIRSTGWDERKWSSSVLLARRPPAFH